MPKGVVLVAHHDGVLFLDQHYPSRRLRSLDPARSCRKALEIAGSGSGIPT